MHGAHEFLKALATVLCVAAVTTVLFQRLRQPVVLGYLAAGMIIGPHLPIPLIANVEIVQALSDLGVILLMFSLGLEFSLRKLVQVGPSAGITAVVQCSLMMWLGFLVGRLFGWTTQECLFTGALIAISSTTIIAKAFEEHGVRGRLRELVVGILIVEDLIAIVLMALLTAISSGRGLSAGALLLTTGRLVAFLIALLAVGLLIVPRAMRAIVRLDRPETTLVASVGLCFAVALLAQRFGYSIALGAFLAGSLIAESGEERRIEHLVQPVRDLFGAVFFVSVGMLIDPALIARHWASIAALTAVVVAGKLIGVSLGAFLTGSGTRTAVQAGMSLAQIGEFSFIIAGLGLSLGAIREFLYPVAVSISALTTLLTPWLIRASGPVALWVDRKLPRPIQTYAALYGSWVESLRAVPARGTALTAVRRLVRLLLLDAALLAGIIVGVALSLQRVAAYAEGRIGVGEIAARALVVGCAAALAIPLCVGIVRVARRLGVTLATAALPVEPGGRVDLAAAPRRALVVTLQLACVLAVGAPLLALTQPFLPGVPGALALALLLVVLGVAFFRRAADLHGHVRAGAEMIVEVLARQVRAAAPQAEAPPLDSVHALLPGLGAPTPIRLAAESPAVGKTLADLNLRGLTGATALAIIRQEGEVIIPTARERLHAGDVLALAGTRESIEAASALLIPAAEARPGPAAQAQCASSNSSCS